MPSANLQYWSMVTLASAPSGELWDGVFDMQVPLDKDGNYTVLLGSTGNEGMPLNLFTSAEPRWLEVQFHLAGAAAQPLSAQPAMQAPALESRGRKGSTYAVARGGELARPRSRAGRSGKVEDQAS